MPSAPVPSPGMPPAAGGSAPQAAGEPGPGQGPGPDPRVVLYGRDGCHLCDDAEEVVAAVCDPCGEPWAKRSILDDARRRTAYADLIPVIEVDGEIVATWRISAAGLAAALDGDR